MSATTPGRELAPPDSHRRPGSRRPTSQRVPLFEPTAGSAPGSPAGGTRQAPDPHTAPMPEPELRNDMAPETWWEALQRAQRARAGRLRSLWQMSATERIAAMRRGELTYEQLAAWSARHPDQVPIVNGEFEWIAAKTPEACVGNG
jgi:hypothetical protein